MAYEQRNLQGSLFKNTDKEKDTHPDYKGSCQINGTDYWMDAWIKKSEGGRTWMSFSFKAKEQPTGADRNSRDTRTHAQRKRPSGGFDDMPDDIPF